MDILIKPIITEKATAASELYNCYSFLVNTKANKLEIKKAVEAAYGVSVDKVRTLNYGPQIKTIYQNGYPIRKNQCYQKGSGSTC